MSLLIDLVSSIFLLRLRWKAKLAVPDASMKATTVNISGDPPGLVEPLSETEQYPQSDLCTFDKMS